MPYSLCPIPYALFPMPYARRVPHVTEKGYSVIPSRKIVISLNRSRYCRITKFGLFCQALF